LGGNLPTADALAEFYALIAARLATGSGFAMPLQDSFSVGAVVMIVIHISMFGRVFGRVRVVRRYFGHVEILLTNRL
jgi:hypothetical protein